MAWTSPMTAIDNATWTAAQFNTHVRDNLLETMPGKAAAAGRWFVVSGTNAIAERVISEASVATAQTTGSTSYVDLATVGPAITVTTGTKAIVFWGANMSNATAAVGSNMSVAVSVSTTIAASNTFRCCTNGHTAANGVRVSSFYRFSLTAGSNTFTAKYRSDTASLSTFSDRMIAVLPL